MATPPENVDTTPVAADAGASGRGGQDITPQQLAIVAGVVLVILLGLVYFFFLRGGDEEELATPPVAEGLPAPEETAPPEEDDADGDDGGEVETFEVFAPRDPFEPLISAGGAGAAPGTGGDAGAGAGDGDGDGGIDGDGDGTAPGEGPAATNGQDIGTHRVRVVDVYEENGRDRAQVQVDGTVYTVDEGENFAENFRLVSASGRCATILFGDDEFTLCEGEEILK
ncbi:MAG: hypothetical protein KY391_00815 [Actinobacteria bacterium]|nr:hypothetical protein [Actinomycetota bacterium]